MKNVCINQTLREEDQPVIFLRHVLKSLLYYQWKNMFSAPEINISPVPDTMSGSRHFLPVTRNSSRSPVYDILLKFENLPVIVTGRK